MKRMNTVLYGLVLASIMGGGLMLNGGRSPAVRAQAAEKINPDMTAPLPANAPFAEEINAFQKADQQQMPLQGAVLFVGSSSIRLWEHLARDFPELPVINRGFGGSQIEDSVRYADRIVIPYQPKLIVFYAGGNDINAGKTPEKVLQDFQAFVVKAHKALPTTRIAFVSINPSIARWSQEAKILKANRLVEKYVRETDPKAAKLSFIASHAGLLGADGQPQAKLLREDHLHLNADGYKVWKALIKPQILALANGEGVKGLAQADNTAAMK